tara:strand:+ start:441 stop:641 length:201 start_codon:yes stop_codon:yes gene_type:complete
MPPTAESYTKPEDIETTELIELENGYVELKNIAKSLKDEKIVLFFDIQLKRITKILKKRIKKALNT